MSASVIGGVLLVQTQRYFHFHICIVDYFHHHRQSRDVERGEAPGTAANFGQRTVCSKRCGQCFPEMQGGPPLS